MRANNEHNGIVPNVHSGTASNQDEFLSEGQTRLSNTRWMPVKRGDDHVLHDDGLSQDLVVSPVPNDHERAYASTH